MDRTAVLGRRRGTIMVLAVAALMLLAITMGSSAPAAASPDVGRQGAVTLYTGSLIDPILRYGYDGCASPVEWPVPAEVVGFDHRSIPGCQALLVDRTGAVYLLCNGAGTVPDAFTDATGLRIRSGDTPPCGLDA